MITVLAVHFAVAVVAPVLFHRFGRNAFYVLAAVPAYSFVWLVMQHGAVYAAGSGGPRAGVQAPAWPTSCPGSPN
ncbi:hypothetical protein ACOM2C_11580 [Pseudarthrobacter sp. So.54]